MNIDKMNIELDEIENFLKEVRLENDEEIKYTLTKGVTYYSYLQTVFSKVKSLRKIYEAEIYIREKRQGDKKTEKEIEMITRIEAQDIITLEIQLEGIISAVEQIIVTARKLIELAILEKRNIKFTDGGGLWKINL